MKKKLSLLLAITMATSMLLTACTNPLKKDNTDTPAVDVLDDEIVTDMNVTLTDKIEYSVGDVVSIDDIVIIGEEDALNVTNKAILNQDGSIATELNTTTAGTFTVNIVIEAINGGWSGTYTYDVVEATYPVSVIEKFVGANVNEFYGISYVTPEGWSVVNPAHWGTEDASVEDLTINASNAGNIESITIIPVSGSGAELDNDIYITETFAVASYLSVSTMGDDESLKILSGENFDEKALLNNFKDYWRGLISYEDCELEGITVYGKGTSYTGPVKAVYMDASQILEGLSPCLIMYVQKIEIDGVTYCVYITPKYQTPSKIADLTEKVSYDESIYTVEGIKKYMTDAYTIMYADEIANGAYDSIIEYMSKSTIESLNILDGNFVAGTFDAIVPTDVEVEEEETTEAPTQESKVEDVVITYQSLHKDIYRWPESKTKYRRWCYVVHDTTTYNQSIINDKGVEEHATGTTGDVNSNNDLFSNTYDYSGYDPYSGSTGTSSSSSDSSSSDTSSSEGSSSSDASDTSNSSDEDGDTEDGLYPKETVVLSGDTDYYQISNSKKRDVEIDTDMISEKSVRIKYDNKTYYIELCDEYKVASYNENLSLGRPSDMNSMSNFTITTGANTSTTSGTITPYNINYTNNLAKQASTAYLATYRFGNDYLTIYCADGKATSDTLVTLLKNLVTIGE